MGQLFENKHIYIITWTKTKNLTKKEGNDERTFRNKKIKNINKLENKVLFYQYFTMEGI